MDNVPDNSQRSLTFVNLCAGLRRVQVMNKERLAKLKKSLAPSVNVCDHIAKSVMNNNYSFEIFPIYTCIGFNHTVFCTEDNFEEVKAFILKKLPNAKREDLPTYW